MEENKNYTKWNRILKSQLVQTFMNKSADGTLSSFIEDWKWIFQYSKKYRKAIYLYVVLGIFGSTLSLVSAISSKYMIDIIVNRKIDQLWVLAVILISSILVSVIFQSFEERISLKISLKVNQDIQRDIFGKIMDARWQEIQEFEKGDLLNRFDRDISSVAANAVNWIPQVIISIYTFLATLLLICYYDMIMAFIVLLSIPILFLFSRYLLKRLKDYKEKILKINSDMMSFQVETFYNLDTIKSFGSTEHYQKKLEWWQEKYQSCQLEYNWFSIKSNGGIAILKSLVGFITFAYCLFRMWTDVITYGTMTLFLQQSSNLTTRFNQLVKILPGMLTGAVSAHRIRELTELPQEFHNLETGNLPENFWKNGVTVEFKQVDFSYTPENPVLKESDFLAKPGEIVALVGPSGEGKTTILRLLLNLVHPENGQVLFHGNDGKVFPANADFRRYFSYVPQGNTLLSGTIAENLRMGKEAASEEEMIQALKAACAWEFVSKIQEGIYGRIGEKGKGVSEGQAQRIAIARAVLRDAPILLLDEATSALDVKTERQVLRNIMRMCPEKTCIITTHRPSVLGMCKRIYRVMDKRIMVLDEETVSEMIQDF